MKELIDVSGHVSQQILRDFACGSLQDEDLIKAAEHIAACEVCAASLAEITAVQPIAPAGFEEEVLKKLPPNKRRMAELLQFSFRVAIAASIAFLFIFSGLMNGLANMQELQPKIESPDFSVVQNINEHLQNFSRQILHWEVFKGEKTK